MDKYICKLYPFWTGAEVEELREKIIRCRDCKHFKEDGCKCRYFLSQYPSTVDGVIVKGAITMSYVDPNDFCAWAERDA